MHVKLKLSFSLLQHRLADQQQYIETLRSSGGGDNVRPTTNKQVNMYVCICMYISVYCPCIIGPVLSCTCSRSIALLYGS